jgi:uncharacterized protein YceH (UPF0502 family)
VTKYEHWLGEAYNFSRAETALLCVLLLRGPQTPGELRGRTERLHRFDEISEALGGLQKLMDREPALVAVLPRQPGTKESRYAHLLCGAVEAVVAGAGQAAFVRHEFSEDGGQGGSERGDLEGRVVQLESAVADLQQKIEALHRKIDDLFGD